MTNNTTQVDIIDKSILRTFAKIVNISNTPPTYDQNNLIYTKRVTKIDDMEKLLEEYCKNYREKHPNEES